MPENQCADGTILYYETYPTTASTQKPWVVFLNGMTQTTLNWKSLARGLTPRANVLLYDARGQGKSEIGAAPLELELHAQDLASVLEHAGIQRAHLAGFSHGARVALGFARDFPDMLDRLLLCSATAMPTATAQLIVRGWREVLRLGGIEAMSWMSLPSILGETFLAQNEALIGGIVKASVRRNTEEGARRLLEGMMRYPDLSELAAKVRAPTLVLSATQDVLVEHEGAQRLAELAGGRHISVADVGHTIPIEAPDVFSSHVVNFFEL